MSRLFQDSGGDNGSRIIEAKKLLNRVAAKSTDMTDWERNFCLNIRYLAEKNSTITAKQIFTLRDIADKYDV